MVEGFLERGWVVFPPEPAVTNWVRAARQDALRALRDPALAHWHQCENTWFVGLHALDNDAEGRVPGSDPLSGQAVALIARSCGGWPSLHRAQVSGVFPGYPRPREGESDAAYQYRRNRDAAHVDGVIGIGTPKRRFVTEPHAFILGLPLTEADAKAAPLVAWQGSHAIMREAFQEVFTKARDGNALSELDVTEAYQSARRQVFETCPRIVVHGPPGCAYLLHRLTLHGVAPWDPDAQAAPEGRLIAYFRPPMPGGARAWVDAP